jgi:hypothetical protein
MWISLARLHEKGLPCWRALYSPGDDFVFQLLPIASDAGSARVICARYLPLPLFLI